MLLCTYDARSHPHRRAHASDEESKASDKVIRVISAPIQVRAMQTATSVALSTDWGDTAAAPSSPLTPPLNALLQCSHTHALFTLLTRRLTRWKRCPRENWQNLISAGCRLAPPGTALSAWRAQIVLFCLSTQPGPLRLGLWTVPTTFSRRRYFKMNSSSLNLTRQQLHMFTKSRDNSTLSPSLFLLPLSLNHFECHFVISHTFPQTHPQHTHKYTFSFSMRSNPPQLG